MKRLRRVTVLCGHCLVVEEMTAYVSNPKQKSQHTQDMHSSASSVQILGVFVSFK